MRASVLTVVAWLLLGCFAPIPVSRADAPAEDVVKLVDEGLKLRTEGRDAEALGRFEAAYAKRKEPRTLVQIALAEQALGRWEPAHAHLSEALSRRDDAWINQRRGPLDGALKRIESELGGLEVVSNVPGSAVWMNGREVGSSPLSRPILVLPGSVAIRVQAAGHLPFEQTVEVSRGKQARVVADLKAEPAPKLAAAPVVQPHAEPAVAAAEPASRVPEPMAATEDLAPARNVAPPTETGTRPVWRRPSVLLGVAGMGVASIVAAGATYAVAGKKTNSLKKDCYEVACDDDEREERRGNVKTLDRTSQALLGLGLTAVVGSGITYLIAHLREKGAKAGSSRAAPITVGAALERSSAALLGTMTF